MHGERFRHGVAQESAVRGDACRQQPNRSGCERRRSGRIGARADRRCRGTRRHVQVVDPADPDVAAARAGEHPVAAGSRNVDVRDVDRLCVRVDVAAGNPDRLQPRHGPFERDSGPRAGDPHVRSRGRDGTAPVRDHEKRDPNSARRIVGGAGSQGYGLPRGVPQPVERVSLRATPRYKSREREDGERNTHASMLVGAVVHAVRQGCECRRQGEHDETEDNCELEQAGFGHRITSLRS